MNSQLFSRISPAAARKLHISSRLNTSRPSPLIDSIIRVDHAGELGADRIYAGQMAVLGSTKMGPLIQHMWEQEKVHKATFEKLIVKHRVRPTALVPIWNIAGFVLGAGTALMGEKAAMACTVAVESVIVDHYNDQLRALMTEPEDNKELMQTIQKFRDEEQEHHDCGIDHGAEQAPFYKALSEVIKFGCKTAIALSKLKGCPSDRLIRLLSKFQIKVCKILHGSFEKGLLSSQNQYNIIISRSYCVSTDAKPKLKWDLYSGVCLERKPVIVKPLNEFEQKVFRMMNEIESEKSHKSDHEVKMEEDKKVTAAIKNNPKMLDLNVVLQQTAHEFEEITIKEFDAFQPAPVITVADKNNDVKSLNRKLSSHLLLVVNEKVNNEDSWMLPQGIRKGSETLRETAERVLREKLGNKLNVMFLGNAPCGFFKYPYPKALGLESYGGKVFFFKAFYLSGQVELSEHISDYQWAARMDLEKLFKKKKYFNRISNFLIDDDDEANVAVKQIHEQRKESARQS